MFPLAARWTRTSRAGFLFGAAWLGGWIGGGNFPAIAGAEAIAPSFDVRPVEGWQPNTVTAILQSRDGYLWLGTYNGLVRFDGARFTTFDSSTTRGLRNSRITRLYEDDQGAMWIGHETGELTQFAGGEFHPVSLGPGWPGGSIEAIGADETGELWLLNANALLYGLRAGRSLQFPGGASANQKPFLARTGDGRLWVASRGMIATLKSGQVSPVESRNGTNFCQGILPARDGGMWIMEDGRVRKWRDGNGVADLGPSPWGLSFLTVLLETRAGALLAGTLKEGLYLMVPGGTSLHFSRTNGLSRDWVRALCEDREGNIWIGTGSGLDTLRPRKVQMLNPPDGWQGCAVMSFTVSRDGSAWIGTEGAGLYHYRDDEWTCFKESTGLAAFVWSVLETRPGELLVGSWGGGLRVKNGDRFDLQNEIRKIRAPVVSMYEGRHGEIWIGTTSGLHKYEAGKLVWSADKDSLAQPDIRAIAESPDGTLWFGMMGGGLGCLKDGALKQIRKPDGLNSDFVVSLYAESDGTLWIGTSDSGLGRLSEGVFAAIGAAQGLPSRLITHIVDDGMGNLWMGSHNGILRASKTDLRRCADGAAKSIHCLTYGKVEGLASQTCTSGFQPGACLTSNGQIWFPTAKGLAIIDPSRVTTNDLPPPVVIEEFVVDGQAQGLGSPRSAALEIPPGKQRFELRYTGLSFANPEEVCFRYRLEGIEPAWSEAGSRRFAQYSYLPPGDYDFHVIACNNDGVWNETGASLAFRVLPHFWQTWWFRLVSLLAGAGAVAGVALGVARHRMRRKLEHLERQRAIERERARIARDIHDDLGASLTRITMLSRSVRGRLEGQPEAVAEVDRINRTARELTAAMDEIVWAVNPKRDSLDSLSTYLGGFAQTFLNAAGISCRLDLPLQLPAWPLTSEVRHNVFLAFKEAMNNIVKHSGATEVQIALALRPGGFVLAVADNGRGFDLSRSAERPPAIDGTRLAAGNGLLNMRKRLEELGGRCEWQAVPGQGTRVTLEVPVAQ